MAKNDQKPVFVVYKSSKPIDEKFAFIIINYCATGLSRWNDWLLLVPEVDATSTFRSPRICTALTEESLQSLAQRFTVELLEAQALKLAEGCLYSYFHQNPIGEHDREIFAELYTPKFGEPLKFKRVTDPKHGLREIIFDGTESNRNLLRQYKDSVNADEPLLAEITECLRIWEKQHGKP